jgi:hypothetical protein
MGVRKLGDGFPELEVKWMIKLKEVRLREALQFW